MYKLLLILLLTELVYCELNSTVNECQNVKIDISAVRKRRQLIFPDKTVVVLTLSLVKAFMVHAPSGWNLVLEIDVMFPLPDSKFTNAHYRRKLHSRQKREAWESLQRAIDLHNLNGRLCILKSVCEANTSLAPPGRSLVHDILRSVFAFSAHSDSEEITNSYQELLDPNFCERENDCPFSILNFVLDLNKQKY